MEHYKNLSLKDIDGEIWKDIEDWEVQVSKFEPANKFSRTVGYWLSRPEIRLANKMPKYLYHGTSTNLWYEGIKQKGLVPGFLPSK